MIKRRDVALVVLLCLYGCSERKPPLESRLPPRAGDFTIQRAEPLGTKDAPEMIRQLGLKRAASATYTGPTTINVRIFEMNVETSAFELIQKWRQQDGLAVYTGPYFIIADQNAGRDAAGLLENLRKQLK